MDLCEFETSPVFSASPKHPALHRMLALNTFKNHSKSWLRHISLDPTSKHLDLVSLEYDENLHFEQVPDINGASMWITL